MALSIPTSINAAKLGLLLSVASVSGLQADAWMNGVVHE